MIANSKRRKGLMAASALLGGILVLSGCSDGDASASGDSGKDTSSANVDEAAAQKTSEAQIKITPGDGTNNASINNSAAVTVSKGTLTEVTMTTADGAAVQGEMSADRTSWKPSGQLERSTTYKLAVSAKDSDGRVAHENASFSTVSRPTAS